MSAVGNASLLPSDNLYCTGTCWESIRMTIHSVVYSIYAQPNSYLDVGPAEGAM
jgi:hypothetical protein